MQKVIDIEPIWADYVPILTEKDLEGIIELPLLEACKIFYRKNIVTLMSSCNKYNVVGLDLYTEDNYINSYLKKKYAIGNNHAWLMMEYDSLSEENKKIMEKYHNKDPENFIYSVNSQELYDNAPEDFKEKCHKLNDMPHYKKRTIFIRMPLTKATTTKEVNEYFKSIANSFVSQENIKEVEKEERFKLIQLAKKYKKPLEQMEIKVNDTMFKNLYLCTFGNTMERLYGIENESPILWTLFIIATLDLFNLLEEKSQLLILSVEKNDIMFLYNGKEYHIANGKPYPKEKLLQFGDSSRGKEKLKQEKELIDLFRKIDDYSFLLSYQNKINKEINNNM